MNGQNANEFYVVWDKWVVPTIKQIYDQMDPEFKASTNLIIRDLEVVKEEACAFFLKKRDNLKARYYGERKNDQRMDFHKLSALLCRTLIEYKIYDFNVVACEEIIENIDSKNTDWLVKNALANFRLAFYVSVVFLYQSTLFSLKEKDTELYMSLRQKRQFDLYKSNERTDPKKQMHESFENSIVLDLAKRDISNRSFDYFLYSTIMFQLEEYNKLLLKNRI